MKPGLAQHLQTRHVEPRFLVCTVCTRLTGRPVRMTPVRVYQDGLHRPGVTCPRCHTTFIEDEHRHG